MGQFRKKPVVIEAHHFDGSSTCAAAMRSWMRGNKFIKPTIGTRDMGFKLEIDTMEGVMIAQHGDWIIKGVKGEFYPCKPDIFQMTYEPVEELDFRQRVIQEKAELDEKIEKLTLFCYGQTFETLPLMERERLNMQRHLMVSYSAILGARIEAFPK